jgi:acetyltransferase-like isoleucine patch superfamily enzyme
MIMKRLALLYSKILIVLILNYEHRIFSRLRVLALRRLGAVIGDGVVIKGGVLIYFPENIRIGNNVSIQQNCLLSAHSPIIIGNDVSIAHGVSIVTTTHAYNKVRKIREAVLFTAPVIIENNCWIGMKSSILHGVTIGCGVVVGAHALVNRSIASNKVVAGVPAKVIKLREDE